MPTRDRDAAATQQEQRLTEAQLSFAKLLGALLAESWSSGCATTQECDRSTNGAPFRGKEPKSGLL